MHRATRLVLLGSLVVLAVAGLAAGAHFMPSTAQTLSRRDLMLGVLTLGILALAAFGFDLRDWL